MKALRHLYTSGVLWLLSLVAKDAVAAIYRRGQVDGMTELRDFMRGDLMAFAMRCAISALTRRQTMRRSSG
jgi:hypothetical protein